MLGADFPLAKYNFLQCIPFCRQEGGEELNGRRRGRTFVSIFSSSCGAFRLTNGCFHKMGTEKPEQPSLLTAAGLLPSMTCVQPMCAAMIQHHAGATEGCRSDPRSGLRLPT